MAGRGRGLRVLTVSFCMAGRVSGKCLNLGCVQLKIQGNLSISPGI